jgi:tetratricopeptide (TPR) repeat protein
MRTMVLSALLAVAPAQAAAPQKDAPAEAAPRKTQYLEGLGRSAQEERLLREVSDALKRYEDEAREFKHEVQTLIEKKFEQRRGTVAGSYDRAMRELEEKERKERLEAIAQFERFLTQYPNDDRYTADVMFRLAELHYEKSSDEHLTAMRAYEDKVKALKEGEPPPDEPQVSFAPSIALYQALIARFPDYGLVDSAYYLLGYCHEKQNDFDKSRAIYSKLISLYPTSKFATEAWVRIGEYYFDALNEPEALTKAAQAYEAAIRNRTHPLYDKALYKLGWTYYRMDRFEDAVARFLRLVDAYDAKAPSEAAGDLRDEALQYTAISFTDERWGSLEKAQETFRRMGGRPYEGEVYRRMGNVYFDQTQHPEAIAAYELVLQREPVAKDAPQLQQRIIQAYERDRKLAEAFRESEKLAKLYAPGTPWYERHKRDRELINASQDLAEKSLYSTAIYHHQQALLFKQESKFEQAKAEFDVATQAYATYLGRFPRTKNSYEMQFYHAECLYNSFHFAEAARAYVAVRDSTYDTRFQADAAFAAVLAWQRDVEAQVRQGKLPDLKPLRSADRGEQAPAAPIPLAEPEKGLVAAADTYVALYPKDEKSAGVAYKAAELFYAHNAFPEARRRFEDIVKAYPRAEVAQFSTNLIVESYLITKDWAAVEDVSARLAANQDVIDPSSPLHKDLMKFKLAGRFKRADALMKEGKHEAAAEKYIQLVDEEPKHEFADKALNNAAVSYEQARRFDSALKLYERIFREYPASPLADAALFRVAVNAENSYDFEKAVVSYQRLVKEYPASKNREAALFNAARLLEGQQRYPEAAAAFRRYAELFPNAEDAPRNQFRAALISEKQQDWKGAIRALDDFVKAHGGKASQAELVIDAKRRIGDAHGRLGNEAEAQAQYEAAAREFDRRGLKAEAAPIAAEAAARARFQLAEATLKAFDRLRIGGKGKALENSFAAKRAGVKRVQDAYSEVFKYKRLEWTLAALYRRGYVLERFASTLIETPVPPDVTRLGEEAVIAYQDLLAQQTTTLEDRAVESYAATLAEARKNRISNDWTKKTLESLHRFRPKEYPVLKEPKPSFADEPRYPQGLVGTAGEHPPPAVASGGTP